MEKFPLPFSGYRKGQGKEEKKNIFALIIIRSRMKSRIGDRLFLGGLESRCNFPLLGSLGMDVCLLCICYVFLI